MPIADVAGLVRCAVAALAQRTESEGELVHSPMDDPRSHDHDTPCKRQPMR